MTRTAPAPATLRPTEERLAVLLDRAEISDLIDTYVVGLDTAEQPGRDQEWYRRIFTDDVRLRFPIGERVGIDGLAEFQRQARLTWQLTHHVSGNHLIELDGDRARIRVQVLGTHVEYGVPTTEVAQRHRLDVGGHYDATAVRDPRGWRIDRLHFDVEWTSGGGKPSSDYGDPR